MTVKLMIAGRRRAGQTLADHRRHMQHVHGALVLDFVAADPEHAPIRYVQNHVFDGMFAEGDPATELLARTYDFLTEIWFPDLAAAKASQQRPFYLEKLKPDEPRMVDDARVVARPYAEQEIGGVGEAGPFKVFCLMVRVAAIAELGPRHIRNTPLVPGPFAAIDEFWLPDEASAQALAARCWTSMAGDGAILLAREVKFTM